MTPTYSLLTAAENHNYNYSEKLRRFGHFHRTYPVDTGLKDAPTLDGSKPSTPTSFTHVSRRLTPQTPRMSRLEKEAAKNARGRKKKVSILIPPLCPQIVEADQAPPAGIKLVPDPLEPTILPRVAEKDDVCGAEMPPVASKTTLPPFEAVPPTPVLPTGAQTTVANPTCERLTNAESLSLYRKSLDRPGFPILETMEANMAARVSISTRTTRSQHQLLQKSNLAAISRANCKLSKLKATTLKETRIAAIHASLARRVSGTAPSVLRTFLVQELDSHFLFVTEGRLGPFSWEKFFHHLSQAAPSFTSSEEPDLTTRKSLRKRKTPEPSRLYRAAKRKVKTAVLNLKHLRETQERLTATKDGPFMCPGSRPPVLASPLVPPSWAVVMTGGYRHYRIRRNLRAYRPPSPKKLRSCAGLDDGHDRPLSGSYHSVLQVRFVHVPTRKEKRKATPRKEKLKAKRNKTRIANRCKTPRSCAGGDPGPSRRSRSEGAPHSTPSRSSSTPSRPYSHGGYRPGEGGDDGRGRPPPQPPNHPCRGLPDLQIRCYYSNHAGQCWNICTPHNGHFPHRVGRKHSFHTFCSANCKDGFLRDELDTVVSQSFPPNYRAVAKAKLSKFVWTLLKGKCPDTEWFGQGGRVWPLRMILERTVRITGAMDLQEVSARAVYTRLLYDHATDTVNYPIDEDKKFKVASVGLLLWAENSENQRNFLIVDTCRSGWWWHAAHG